VNDEIINSWASDTVDYDDGLREMLKRPCSEKPTCESRCRSSTNGLNSKQGECQILEPHPVSENGAMQTAIKLPPLISADPQTAAAPLSSGNSSEACKSQSNFKGRESCPTQRLSPNTSSELPCPRPCKLLTHLAANPRADITQMTTAPDAEPEKSTQVDGGVPCSRAYRMLMHYATTEPKLDYISQVLEGGCVPHSGSGGGCSVKNTTIWQALDQLSCDEPAT